MNPVALGDSVYPMFGTSHPSTAAAANADTTPTVTIEKDGAPMAYAPTVTNVATGLYRYQIDVTAGNGFVAGSRYVVYAVATVNAITGRAPIDEFEVLSEDMNTMASRLDAAVSSRLATAGYSQCYWRRRNASTR